MPRAGFDVSINTDHRLMSDVMSSSELLGVARTFDLTDDEVRRLVTNGIMARFDPTATRRTIANRLLPQ